MAFFLGEMFNKKQLRTLTICATASLAISQPAYAQTGEFKISAFYSPKRLIFEINNPVITTKEEDHEKTLTAVSAYAVSHYYLRRG